MSAMKKSIPIIHLFSQNHNAHSQKQFHKRSKKSAIIFIGRQHSGQTQSSFIIEQLVQSLLISNNESQFLLQKFDIYICPMLNIDGVYLGNYRTNAYGYDLNRYWHAENQFKMPEIFYFKKFIATVRKKNQIKLIIDLHGHNKKQFVSIYCFRLNSFFFGNPYGKNYMLIPYVASKISEMIRFKSCTFHEEKSEKSKTARVTFGNLLKESTYFYTFQVSFWGYKKNNRITPYTIETLKQFSKVLLSTIYKVFMEEIKEQITLKESIYFKEIKKQLTIGIGVGNENGENFFQKQSQSDSQAQQITIKEEVEKQKQSEKNFKNREQKEGHGSIQKNKDVGIQVDLHLRKIQIHQQEVLIYEAPFQGQSSNRSYFQKLPTKSENLINFQSSATTRMHKIKPVILTRQSKQTFYDLAFNKVQKQSKFNFPKKSIFTNSSANNYANSIRKQYLLEKLRILGETFVDNFDLAKKEQIKFKNVGVQAPDNIDFKKQWEINLIGQKTQIMNKEFVFSNQVSRNQEYTKIGFQKTKDKRKSQIKRKNHSLIMTKGGKISQDTQIYSNNSISQIHLSKQMQKSSKLTPNALFIKISKEPLVRIDKLNPSSSINSSTPAISSNISFIPAINYPESKATTNAKKINQYNYKRNSKSLRHQFSQKLPQIQTSLVVHHKLTEL